MQQAVGVQNGCNREKETEHMKPKIRMVGLDLDGTVFNNNKEITTHTRSVLKEAIHQGFRPPEDRKSDFRVHFWRFPVWNTH